MGERERVYVSEWEERERERACEWRERECL